MNKHSQAVLFCPKYKIVKAGMVSPVYHIPCAESAPS